MCVILIYRRGFEYLKYFKPSFLFGLEKYYPKASQLFDGFIEDLSNKTVFELLTRAKAEGNIKADVNIELVVKIYFFRVDNLLFKSTNLFELYTEEDLFKHLVIYNLKGIISSNYTNHYME